MMYNFHSCMHTHPDTHVKLCILRVNELPWHGICTTPSLLLLPPSLIQGEIWLGADNQEERTEWGDVLRDAGKVWVSLACNKTLCYCLVVIVVKYTVHRFSPHYWCVCVLPEVVRSRLDPRTGFILNGTVNTHLLCTHSHIKSNWA